ncbi:MAG TPA: hypothetical protein V6D17_19670 [Candidatus Obscuribacterales bacterium]
MDTTYKQKVRKTPTAELKPVSPWRDPDFQRFTAITLGTALLLSLVGAFNLRADVDNLTKEKVPILQQQIATLNWAMVGYPHAF